MSYGAFKALRMALRVHLLTEYVGGMYKLMDIESDVDVKEHEYTETLLILHQSEVVSLSMCNSVKTNGNF